MSNGTRGAFLDLSMAYNMYCELNGRRPERKGVDTESSKAGDALTPTPAASRIATTLYAPLTKKEFSRSLLFAETPATFIGEVESNAASQFMEKDEKEDIPVIRIGKVKGELLLVLGEDRVLYKEEPRKVSALIRSYSAYPDRRLIAGMRSM